jgi:hypothetical protein
VTERPGDLVEVEWLDSTGHGEWHDPEEAKELLTKLACLSVGYLVADEPTGIVISLGVGDVGQYLDSMAIPRVAIVSMTRLTPSKKVAT